METTCLVDADAGVRQPSPQRLLARAFLGGAAVGVACTLLATSLATPRTGPVLTGAGPPEPLLFESVPDSGQRLLLLNSDLGLGSVQVPWALTAEDGTLPNSSLSGRPDLKLPNVSCTKIVSRAKLCKGCIPNDLDDSQVVAWAMNLMTESDPRLHVVGISQTFGNADHASADVSLKRLFEGKGWSRESTGMMHQWALEHGGKKHVLHIPSGGSASAVIDFGVPMRKFVDIGDRLELLADHLKYAKASCLSPSVRYLHKKLMEAPRPVHLVGTGPATDLGCLVRNYGGPELFEKIAGVYFLGGRRWGEGINLCNGDKSRCLPGLSDFNVRLNPVALETLLKSGLPPEKLIFVPFELSGQFGNSVTAETFIEKGAPEHCGTPSRQFFMNNLLLRAQWYDRVLHFGERIWLWDLVPFYKALEPTAINCREAKAAIVWCESKSGYKRFHGPSKANSSRNSCAGHSVFPDESTKGPFPSMVTEAAQLWVCPSSGECSEPSEVEKVPVTVCDEWASDAARERFLSEALSKSFY